MKIVREEIDYKKQMENNNKNMKKSKETDTVIAVDPTYADAMEQDKKAEEKVGEIMKKKKKEQKSIEIPDPSTGKPLKKNMYTKQAELDESLFDDGEGEEVEEEKNPTKLPEDVFTMVYDFIFDGIHKSPASIKGLEDVEDVIVGAEKYFQDVQNFTNIGVQIRNDEKDIAEYVKKIADALGFSTSEKRYERGVKNGDYVLFVEIPKDVAVMKASRFLGKNESLKESRFPRFELDIWVPGSGGDDERERTLIRTDDIGEVLETIYKTELDSGEAFLFSDLRRNFELDQEYSQEDMYNDLKDRLGDEFDFSNWDEYFVESIGEDYIPPKNSDARVDNERLPISKDAFDKLLVNVAVAKKDGEKSGDIDLSASMYVTADCDGSTLKLHKIVSKGQEKTKSVYDWKNKPFTQINKELNSQEWAMDESKKCNEAEKNPKFDGMTIEEIFWDVVGKKFDVFDDKGYFTDEAEKHYNEVASLYGEDAFDKLCDEEECFAESKKCNEDEETKNPKKEAEDKAYADLMSGIVPWLGYVEQLAKQFGISKEDARQAFERASAKKTYGERKKTESTIDRYGYKIKVGDKVVIIGDDVSVGNVTKIVDDSGDTFVSIREISTKRNNATVTAVNRATFKFDTKYGYFYGYVGSLPRPKFTNDKSELSKAYASFNNWSMGMYGQGGRKEFVSFDSDGNILDQDLVEEKKCKSKECKEKKLGEGKKLTEDAKIYISLSDYKPWSGAVDTFDKIRKEDKMDELDAFIEEMYPDGLTDTELNDLLWFEPEYVFDSLGIDYEDEDEEDEDEDDEIELDFEEEDEEETDEE